MRRVFSWVTTIWRPMRLRSSTTNGPTRSDGALSQRLWLLLGASCCSVALLASLASSAGASAYGCTTSGSGLPWYGLNSAYTCIDIEGWGNHVVSVQGQWGGVGTICNYRFQIWFSNVNNRVYETDNSPLHIGCRAAAAVWTKNYNDTKRTGRVCVQVLESGAPRPGAACESIA